MENKQKLTAEGLLRFIRSHDLSYMDACCLLDNAQSHLKAIITYELNHLPIADGIEDNYIVTNLKLRSREESPRINNRGGFILDLSSRSGKTPSPKP